MALTGGALIGSLSALLLSRQDNRQCLSQAFGRTFRDLRGTLVSAGRVTADNAQSVAAGVQHGAANVMETVTDMARPLPGALAGGVGTVMQTLGSTEDMMQEDIHDARQKNRASGRHSPDPARLRALVQTEVKDQLGRHHRLLEQRIHEHFDQQDAVIRSLTTSVNHMTVDARTRRGGRPWFLLLVAGGGYYLARQPQIQEKLRTYLEKLSPDTREHLRQAGESVREGVDHVWKGEDPRPALLDAVQETQQAVEQVVSRVKENATSGQPTEQADLHGAAADPSPELSKDSTRSPGSQPGIQERTISNPQDLKMRM
ncbi:hypothetical protein GCM10008955_10670 [Deinococcus malanensis]|uniref:YtxH domain-containing protein n=1 Tax=Deinococcus malanensis TaxID=1706855 RepID=A0ABQ2EP72_9DEIO|nr:hypothetical protein GCM10008955_10670 [Deinococcus malanensis]